MQKVVEDCERQLSDACSQSMGLLRALSLDDWMGLVRYARSGELSPFEEKEWTACFQLFLGDESRRLSGYLDEASFLIRLMAWYQTRMQRSWYIKAYGRVSHSECIHPTQFHGTDMTIPHSVLSSIKCPRLPPILPFHTVRSFIGRAGPSHDITFVVHLSIDGSNHSHDRTSKCTQCFLRGSYLHGEEFDCAPATPSAAPWQAQCWLRVERLHVRAAHHLSLPLTWSASLTVTTR
jgi:hypothetical protein